MSTKQSELGQFFLSQAVPCHPLSQVHLEERQRPWPEQSSSHRSVARK